MADQPQDPPETAASTSPDAPYQSLYRRYRPQRFSEVRGQDHVVRALRNAVRSGHVAHAYLFSGPRGTGKTSTARILAMALNCENPVDGEPDGTCASCVDIRRGASLDVHELDAASARGLDEMRELLSGVALGTRGRWKVYIIDEVHQLTAYAASALLKTLEEPPSHVVFILATTDPQKVLPTIVSRTQPFEFRLFSSEVLGGLLRDINEQAGLGVEAAALDAVVRRGRGSARDALSVLDQVAAAGVVEDDSKVIVEIIEGMIERDVPVVLRAVAAASAGGRDARRLGAELIEHLRNGFLAQQARELVPLTDDAAAVVEDQAQRLGLASLVRALEVLGQALIDMRDSVDARITLEVALIRLSSVQADSSAAALAERIERLERAVASGSVPGLTVGAAGSPASAAGGGGAVGSGAAGASSAADAGAAGSASIPQASAPQAPARGEPPSVPGGNAGPPGSGRGGAPTPARGGAPARSGPPAAARGAAPPTGPSARSALGAHRRTPPAPRPAAGAPGQSAPAGAAQGPPGRTPATSNQAPPSPSRTEHGPGTAAASAGPPAVPNGSVTAPTTGLPTRDELTTAWGDRILPDLRPGVKAYLAAGRFVAVDDQSATFALPDRVLVERATKVVGEAEDALGRHFGRRVPLRLVLDEGVGTGRFGPGRPPEPEPIEDDPADYQLEDLTDAKSAVVSPEQRLLQAFPGAEEVNP